METEKANADLEMIKDQLSFNSALTVATFTSAANFELALIRGLLFLNGGALFLMPTLLIKLTGPETQIDETWLISSGFSFLLGVVSIIVGAHFHAESYSKFLPILLADGRTLRQKYIDYRSPDGLTNSGVNTAPGGIESEEPQTDLGRLNDKEISFKRASRNSKIFIFGAAIAFAIGCILSGYMSFILLPAPS